MDRVIKDYLLLRAVHPAWPPFVCWELVCAAQR